MINKNKKYLLLILLFPVFLFYSINSDAISLSKKKTPAQKTVIKKATPKLIIKVVPARLNVIAAPAEEYQPFDPIEILVRADNTNEKVQYRFSLTIGKLTKELYNTKDHYGPLCSGKVKTILSMKAFYDMKNGFVSVDRIHPVTEGAIDFSQAHYSSQTGVLRIYVRAKGSKKSYDSYSKHDLVVGCR